jgi:hypothetical protein
VAKEVEAVACRFQHILSCGYHEQPIISVRGESEFAATVRLHPSDTKEATDLLCIARRQNKGIQRLYCATDDLARHKGNANMNRVAARNINPDTTHTREK